MYPHGRHVLKNCSVTTIMYKIFLQLLILLNNTESFGEIILKEEKAKQNKTHQNTRGKKGFTEQIVEFRVRI